MANVLRMKYRNQRPQVREGKGRGHLQEQDLAPHEEAGLSLMKASSPLGPI